MSDAISKGSAGDVATPKTAGDPLPEVASAPPGASLGHYVRTEKLGEGGMGEVWKAWDTSLGRWVALKFVKGTDAKDLERFRREARIVANLSHPNIAGIYEVGEHGGRHFIAMQLVEGETLRKHAVADTETKARLMRDAARAVSFAHDRGVVHRDLKPDNLMVAGPPDRPHVFVMDFGLARTLAGDSRLSMSGAILGTPAYMSPEQATAGAVDRRTDVYGLGATLFELLAKRAPFEGKSPHEILFHVENSDPPRLRRLSPSIDSDLETIVLRCLEKEPARRYATAGELADDLDRFLRGESIRAKRASLLYRVRKSVGRYKAAFGVAAVGTIALAAVLAAPATKAFLESRRKATERRAAWEEARARERRTRALVAEAREALGNGDAASCKKKAEEVILAARDREPSVEFHPVAEAYLLQAEAAAAQKRGSEEMTNLATAYLSGERAAEGTERDAAASALRKIGLRAKEQADFLRARAAFRALERRFPESPAGADAAVLAAECSEQLGELDVAWSERARSPGGVGLLDSLVGTWEFVLPEGQIALVRGAYASPALALLERDGRLGTYMLSESGPRLLDSVEQPTPRHEGAVWSGLWARDVDGDGEEEILASYGPPGRPELEWGGLAIWSCSGKRLRLVQVLALPARATCVSTADLDADGRRELHVGVEYDSRSLRSYVSNAEGGFDLACEPYRLGRGADVLDAAEIRSGPRRFLVVSFGGYSGYRLQTLVWDGMGRRLIPAAASPWPCFARSLLVTNGNELVLPIWWPGDQKEQVQATMREGGAVPDPGLYSAGMDAAGEFSKLVDIAKLPEGVEIERAAVAILGGSPAYVLQRTETTHSGRRARVEVLVRENATIRRFPLSPTGEALVDTTNLDDEADDEILTARRSRTGAVLTIRGLGRPSPVLQDRRDGTAVPTSPGRVLLSAGMFKQAEDACRNAGDDIGAALSLMETGDFASAADVLAEVRGGLRPEALRRLVNCLKRIRAWDRLRAVARELLELPDLDSSERVEYARLEEQARIAGSLADRGRLGRMGEAAAIRLDSPCLARRGEDDIEFLIGRGHSSRAGVRISITGGPFRLRWRMRLAPHAIDAGPTVGLHGPQSLGVDFHESSGNPKKPLSRQSLSWIAEGWAERTTEQLNVFVPAGRWFEVALEYQPLSGSLRTVLTCEGSVCVLDLPLAGPLAPGEYEFGPFASGEAPLPDGEFTVVHLRDLTIEASDPSTRLVDAPPKTARDSLRRANGVFVLQGPAEALSEYRRVSANPRASREDRAAALFFEALALSRSGRPPDEASLPLRELAEIDLGDLWRRLYDESGIGLISEERALLAPR